MILLQVLIATNNTNFSIANYEPKAPNPYILEGKK
jgi:hypothetical protein